MPNKVLIVISGATATGKTKAAIKLSQRYNAPILSADSRQFYKEMEIGTAKPTPEELKQATHYFVNNKSVTDTYTAGMYENEVIESLNEIFKSTDMAILVGGTGMFIKAVTHGLDNLPKSDPTIEEKLYEKLSSHGIESLQEELKNLDPSYFNKVDLQNHRRIIRALNVCHSTGKTFSSYLSQPKKVRSFYPIFLNLVLDRKNLYERINTRVDQMISNGLIEEVKNLLPHRHLPSLKTVGYTEVFDFLDKKIDLETAIALIKQNSRRYAKRQLTWYRNESHWKHFLATDYHKMDDYIQNQINKPFVFSILKTAKKKSVVFTIQTEENHVITNEMVLEKTIKEVQVLEKKESTLLYNWLKHEQSLLLHI